QEKAIPVRLLVPLREGTFDRLHRRSGLLREQLRQGTRLGKGLAGGAQVVRDAEAQRVERRERLSREEQLERVRPTHDLRQPGGAAMTRRSEEHTSELQ